MTRETMIFLDVVLLVILCTDIGSNFFIQASAPEEPKNLQADGWLTDPSGHYVFYNTTSVQNPDGTTTSWFYMNLTSYEKIMQDPYTTQLTGEVQVVGNMVMITSTYPNPPCHAWGDANSSNSTLPC